MIEETKNISEESEMRLLSGCFLMAFILFFFPVFLLLLYAAIRGEESFEEHGIRIVRQRLEKAQRENDKIKAEKLQKLLEGL